MQKRDFIFNGQSASANGLHVGSVDTFGAPDRVTEDYIIPGPMPKIYTNSTMTFNPYTRQYNTAIIRDYNLRQTTREIKRWLLGDPGFHKLEDTYEPDVFRLAKFDGPLNTEWIGSASRSISIPISFTCFPQLFLNEGEKEHELYKGNFNFENPTGYVSYPLIRLVFTSTPKIAKGLRFIRDSSEVIGELTFTGTISNKTLYIDCATQEVYDENGLTLNGLIWFSGAQKLEEGTTTVRIIRSDEAISGDADIDVFVTPRWWAM